MVPRLVAGVLALLLFAGAFVQYNDPDAPLWMALYALAGAALSWRALGPGADRRRSLLASAVGLGALAHIGVTLADALGAGAFVSEQQRELGGLGLTLIAMVWLALPLAKRPSAQSETR